MIAVVWLHVLAATAWIGGMLFLALVLVPVFKAEAFAGERRALFVVLARRFRVVVWTSVFLLISTGAILVQLRFGSVLYPPAWPAILKLKLALVALLLCLTLAHDLWLGSRAARLTSQLAKRNAADGWLLRITPWVARGSLFLILAVLLVAVAVART